MGVRHGQGVEGQAVGRELSVHQPRSSLSLGRGIRRSHPALHLLPLRCCPAPCERRADPPSPPPSPPRPAFSPWAAPPPGASGGETLFCDTLRLLARATPAERELWRRMAITYTTEKIVHYGGTFTSPLITRHPDTGEEVLRFAEPVEDLNPVRLKIEGIPESAQKEFLDDMH